LGVDEMHKQMTRNRSLPLMMINHCVVHNFFSKFSSYESNEIWIKIS